MSLTPKEIKELLDLIEASGWDEAHITVGDSTISVSKSGGARAAAPAPAPATAAAPEPASQDKAPQTPAAAEEGSHLISSPTVGVFWRSPEPGAPPFVEVGDRVDIGTNLCIVEVMKLMNYVPADVPGVVRSIHVENGAAVEHGTVLFGIDPLQD